MGDADGPCERDWNEFWIDGRKEKRTRKDIVKRKREARMKDNDRMSAICSIKKSHSFMRQPAMKTES
jgi:hypothetical protein